MTDYLSGSGPLDAHQALRALSGIVLGDHSFDAVLQRATVVAKRTIPGAAEVSVTVKNGPPTTVAASGRLAEQADEAQYATGTGPCLDAIRLGQTIVVEDQATEDRWPEYVVRALAAGARSSCSVPLPVDTRIIGAFNAYGIEPHAFDEVSIKVAQDLAAYAGIVLNNVGLYFTATSRADQMAEAMKSRAVIEQAKGILMSQRHCSADEAFDILVRLSQQSHRKLREVAQALVDHVLADSA
ncbi:MAG: ANTAR domain-containing protein [Frankiaceae bacterium]